MSLARITAHLSTLSMSVPARVALWLGLGVMVWGYTRNIPAATLMGMVLIMTGTALWLWFRPKGQGWKGLIALPGRQKRETTTPARRKTALEEKLTGLTHKLKRPAQSDPESVNAAVARAQQDPRLQAKRSRSDATRRDRQTTNSDQHTNP